MKQEFTYTYKVTEEDYRTYLQKTRKEKMKKPGNIFLTVILAVMPVGLFLWCLKNGLILGSAVPILGAASFLLSAANVFFRTNYWRFTGPELRLMRENDGESGKFTKEHRFSGNSDGAKLTIGKDTSEFSWNAFGGIREYGNLAAPVFNGQNADLIPLSALRDPNGIDALRETFAACAAAELRKSAAEQAAQENESDVLGTLEYIYTKKTYIRDQAEARRARYLTKVPYNKAFFAKISIIAVLIYAMVQADSAALTAVYALLALLFSLEYIIDFTPLTENRLEKLLIPTLAMMPLKYAKLTVRENGLTVTGDIHYLVIPWTDVVAVRETKHAAALYLASSTILTVPAPPETDAEAYKFFLARAKT